MNESVKICDLFQLLVLLSCWFYTLVAAQSAINPDSQQPDAGDIHKFFSPVEQVLRGICPFIVFMAIRTIAVYFSYYFLRVLIMAYCSFQNCINP